VELLALFSVLLAGLGMLGGIELRERPKRSLQTIEVRFGADVTVDAVQAMIGCIAGLPSGAVVMLDVVAGGGGIRHLLHGEQATIDTLRGQWRAILPGLRLDEPQSAPPAGWSAGAVLRLQGSYPVLRSDAPAEAAAAMLGALQPLGLEEAVMLRFVLAPRSHPQMPQPVGRGAAGPRADHLRALRLKYAGPLLAGVGVVAVRAGHPKRAAHLLSRIVSVARSRRGAYGGLAVAKRGPRALARLLGRRTLPSGDVYSPAELAALTAMPIGAPEVAGLGLGTAPVLMPSPRIPTAGRVLAASTWPGADRALAQPVAGGLSHALVAGPTGVGKSALIANLIVQDLKAGRGCLLIDGKGDLAEDVLARIPHERMSDVVVLDPGRGGPVPGLRVFGCGDHESAELTADLVVSVFRDLFAENWGPLSSRWLRAGLVLLAHDREATLADFPFVFSRDVYRRRLVARVKDPLARQVWAGYEAMGPQERAHQLAAPLNKIEEVIGRKVVRAVLAQRAPKLDLDDVMRAGKIVVVSLSPGQIGSPAARLIGALVVHELFQSVQARAALPPARRKPFFAYIDEPRVLGDIPTPLDSLYEMARGLGCGILLGAQSLTQLPADLRAAVATNAATVVAFRQGADDARLLARELPGTTSEGLQNLGRFEVIARIGLGPGDVSAPVSGRTFPLPPATSDPDVVRCASAERYGADPDAVDRALAERHEIGGPDEPVVGRARRSS
jgi:hypothetical protein